MVEVTGSTIKMIALAGIGTPVIGKAPSSQTTAKSNTAGIVIKKVQWEYWDGGNWVNMPEGSVFEEGKRYAVLVELKPEDGYSFIANESDMTVYINGESCDVVANAHGATETAAELELTSITTPAFTTQPKAVGFPREKRCRLIVWLLRYLIHLQ